jgi:uncharacterized protein (TIGR02594 family)
MARTWKEVQERLINLGYNLGPSGADGDPGRFTREAVQKFQADKKVAVQWPGTVGPKTLAALFPEDDSEAEAKPAPLVRAPWVQLGLKKQGLSETGKTKAELVAFLKSDGKTLGDPAKLPWCGDFVQTCIAVTLPGEPVPSNPYWARNWNSFGQAIEPTFGAVIVFARGSAGHVAFLVGESTDGKAWIILGGNQSNRISVTSKAKADTIGTRWPRTADTPAISLPKMAKSGKLSINEV